MHPFAGHAAAGVEDQNEVQRESASTRLPTPSCTTPSSRNSKSSGLQAANELTAVGDEHVDANADVPDLNRCAVDADGRGTNQQRG